MKRAIQSAQQGFTLVELLIVVIILAILAAIVVPQFASSTEDAKVSSLDTTLANVRAAIDLYYQQHGEYPGRKTAVSTCAATKGSGLADTNTAFLEQMSLYTDSDGKACSVKDATYKFGPYFKKATLPENPISADNALEVVSSGDLHMLGTGANGGWKYDTVTGKFIANDTNNDANGVSYDQH